MRHEIDRFAHLESPIHRWDARWKLAGGLSFLLGLALVRESVACAALGLAAVAGLLLVSRLPVGWTVARLRGVLLFVALVAMAAPLTGPAPYFVVGGVRLSQEGVHLAAMLVLKVPAIVTLVMVLFATAPIQETIAALERLRVPAMLVQLIHFSYRYVFLFADESARMRQALVARGAPRRFSRRTLAMAGQFVGNLLVRSFERAERVQDALLARGYDGTLRTLVVPATRVSDVAKFVVFAGAGVALAVAEFSQR